MNRTGVYFDPIAACLQPVRLPRPALRVARGQLVAAAARAHASLADDVTWQLTSVTVTPAWVDTLNARGRRIRPRTHSRPFKVLTLEHLTGPDLFWPSRPSRLTVRSSARLPEGVDIDLSFFPTGPGGRHAEATHRELALWPGDTAHPLAAVYQRLRASGLAPADAVLLAGDVTAAAA